jgi:antitoxin component YwqK of YwqJK toxin-antitoxin module
MRKHLITILSCIALQCLSFAGLYAKRVYLNQQWETSSKNGGLFYYEKPDKNDDGIYPITIFYNDDIKYCEGVFNNRSVSFDARNGEFSYYFRTGKPMCRGSFANGKKNGYWEIYYPTGGKERTGNYANGKKEGDWLIYDASQNIVDTVVMVPEGYTGVFITYNKGRVEEKTNYVNGVGYGLQETFYNNGNLMSKGNLDSGERVGPWDFYYKSGTLASHIVFSEFNRIDSIFYFEESGEPVTTPIDTAHAFAPACLDNPQYTIAKNLMYPPLAVENGVQGKASFTFIFNPDGSITNVRCIDDIKLDFGLEEECFKVIGKAFKCSPNKMFNIPTRVKIGLPVKFRLM